MTQALQLVSGLAVGGILAMAVLRLRRFPMPERGQIPDGDLGLRMHRSRMTHHASLPGASDLIAAFLGGNDPQQVLYSQDAKEQLVQMGVNREHVETVLSQPTRTTLRFKWRTVQLERDFGGHTLRLQVAEPWPACGAAYVTQIEWRPAYSALRRRSRRRVTGLWRAATRRTSQSRASHVSTGSGGQ